MKFLNTLFGRSAPEAAPVVPTAAAPTHNPSASTGETFYGLDDPALLEFMRMGGAHGAFVGADAALCNMALLRCVRLISESIGMLPCNIIEYGPEKRRAEDLNQHKMLRRKPNGWQTAYEFKTQMQLRALLRGNSYARVIWVGNKPVRMVPIDNEKIQPILTDDWNMVYRYTRPDGGTIDYTCRDIFHLRDLSLDGVEGLSRVKLAKQALALSNDAERAAARLFKNGMMVGGALSHPNSLSDPAHKRLRESMEERYSGAENAGKWMVLEEGMTANKFDHTAIDSQLQENRNHQIEEIARCFGVPRPLLMMDETSWGSGVEQLGIFFVQYALQPWFTAWEQAIARTLFSDAEAERYFAKFNERALLRGTLKDQSEFFSKALGVGGSKPFMTQNEVRDLCDLPEDAQGKADSLEPTVAPTPAKGPSNEPAPKQTA